MMTMCMFPSSCPPLPPPPSPATTLHGPAMREVVAAWRLLEPDASPREVARMRDITQQQQREALKGRV